MIIRKPFTTTIDRENHYTSLLHFEGGAVKKYYMRGSIAWPEGSNEGFALMAGYDLADDVIIIFEEFQFWTVSHWLNEDDTVRKREDGGYHLGLIQFIMDNKSRYKCCSYFWGGQHVDIWRRYGTEVYRHKMLPKDIELIEVPYVKEVGDSLILEKLKVRKFRGQADSKLNVAVKRFFNMQNVNIDRGSEIQALRALLAGFENQPWVDLKGVA